MTDIRDGSSSRSFLRATARRVYRWLRPTTHMVVQRQLRRALGSREDVVFVQVGSNDGLHNDPLRDFVLASPGWRGVFIEPVPFIFERLRANYADAARFSFENVAIGTGDGPAATPFYYVSAAARAALGDELPAWFDQLGSFDRTHIVKHLDGKLEPYIVETEVETVPLQVVLDRNDVTRLDLVHIDTEGFDYDVLVQIDLARYRPAAVLYEHRHLDIDKQRAAVTYLAQHGYSCTVYDGDTLATLAG